MDELEEDSILLSKTFYHKRLFIHAFISQFVEYNACSAL